MASKSKRRKEAPEPQDLLIVEMREIYSAEKQLSRALPRLAKAIENEKARKMLGQRLEEARKIEDDLDQAFETLQRSPGRKKNAAAEGLIDEAQAQVQDFDKGPALDAVLIDAVQKAEHYCIAAWGTARSYARALGEDHVARAMDRALEEAKRFDEELTRLAVDEVNPAVIRESQGGEARA
jgi:ferritin-like metal-binding protein YciE